MKRLSENLKNSEFMKIIVLFSFFIFIGCEDIASKYIPTQECFIINETQDCWFETQEIGCLRGKQGGIFYLALVETKYEYLLNKIKEGNLTAYYKIEVTTGESTKEDLLKNLDFSEDLISKKTWQDLALLYLEKKREVIVDDSIIDSLINLKKEYNCPEPVGYESSSTED